MSLVDLDAMLDGNMDDVQAAPDYVTPPSCIAQVGIAKVELEKFEKRIYDEQGKDTGSKEDAIRVRMTRRIDEVTEYTEDNATPVAPNSMYSDTYLFDEKGKGFFKRDAAKILGGSAEELAGYSFRDIFTALEQSEPQTCIIKTTSTKRGENEFTNTQTTPISVD